MTDDKLREVLRLHDMWLRCEMGGKRADLRGADLRDVNLSHVRLSYADMRYADLGNADLRYASLSNADLSNADLSNANLSHADLREANISNVILAFGPNVNCMYDQPVYQVAGVGNLRRAVTLLAIGERKDWQWFAGCFEGTEDELRAAVSAKYPADSAGYRGYMRSIDYLAAMAEDGKEVEE